MSAISLLRRDEVIKHTTPPVKGRILNITVPIQLTERRIYLYLEALQSAPANFLIDASVVIFNLTTPLAEFPASIADLGTTPGGDSLGNAGQNIQSATSLFSSGGAPVGDSLVISLFDPFDTTTPVNKVTVQPLRINCEITNLALIFNSVAGSNLTGYRAWLGCMSTEVQ